MKKNISPYIYPGIKDHLATIVKSCCDTLKITTKELTATKRTDAIVANRKVVAYYIKKRYKKRFTFAEIGKMLGNKDHSTVIHYVSGVEYALSRPVAHPDICKKYDLLLNSLKQA